MRGMAKPKPGNPSTSPEQADDEVRKNLPPGVKLVRTLRGHTGWIGRIAWSPDGRMPASPSGGRDDPVVGCRDEREPAHAGKEPKFTVSLTMAPSLFTLDHSLSPS